LFGLYDKRNQSSTYSNKLLKTFREAAVLIEKFPNAFVTTDYDQVKAFIILDYILFYEVLEHHILILTVWDSRRNPKQLESILER
jgi:hypothetical protein